MARVEERAVIVLEPGDEFTIRLDRIEQKLDLIGSMLEEVLRKEKITARI